MSDEEERKVTVSFYTARSLAHELDDALKRMKPAIDAAPHALAKEADLAMNDLVEHIFAELGFEIIGRCMECEAPILDGEAFFSYEGGERLCDVHSPSETELAEMRRLAEEDA